MEGRRAQADQGRRLLELARDITASLELQEVLDRSFKAIRAIVDFNGGAIQLIEDQHLVAAAAIPELSEEARSVRIPVGQGISGTIAATGEPVYIADITTDERVSPEARARGTSGGVRSYFGAPLIQYGRPIGVFQIDSTEPNAFPPEVQEQVMLFLPTVSSAVRNALLFDQEREAVEKLQEAEAIKGKFMQIVSHELRTPLAVVMGFTETLVAKVEDLDRDQIRLVAGRTHAAASRLERLVSDLVSVSQAERGKLLVEPEPTDMYSILNQVSFEVGERSHQLEVVADEGLPEVLVDRDRTIQVIDNLVVNAKKFSPEDTTIRITAALKDDRVEVSVTDQGKGISHEDVGKIFDPFFQVDQSSTRAVGGLGIGLYLVRQICTVMNTELDVTSEPGKGSTFVLRFPVAV